MFTGIIEGTGTVERLVPAGTGRRLWVRLPEALGEGLEPGQSLAVNGVCLTVVETGNGIAVFDLAAETLRVTTLGDLVAGEPVNLERPLRVGDRLGGHLVQGHVDGVGRVVALEPEAGGRRLTIAVPAPLRPYLVPRGSVAVDGVSLTVAALETDGFSVVLIPHTLAVTALGRRGVGARVNLEVDVIGKYVHALLAARGAAVGGTAAGGA